jgi:hypothetical protein
MFPHKRKQRINTRMRMPARSMPLETRPQHLEIRTKVTINRLGLRFTGDKRIPHPPWAFEDIFCSEQPVARRVRGEYPVEACFPCVDLFRVRRVEQELPQSRGLGAGCPDCRERFFGI